VLPTGPTSEWLTAATAPLREAPLTHEIVQLAQQLPLPQRDPADRLLAARESSDQFFIVRIVPNGEPHSIPS
jgi:PIN domain nuclease of toxin-antitoxin system